MAYKEFEDQRYRIRKRRGKSSKTGPNKAKASTVQESKKNDEQEPETENDYDELAALSARERRERRIAEFTTDYKPTNPLLHYLNDKTKS